MKIPRPPHNWSVTPRQAVVIQKKLALAVSQVALPRKIRLVAGVDAAFSHDYEHCLGGVVLWDLRDNIVVEQHTATRRLTFPYIPGLLSFREAPALIAALRKLRMVPDLIMCDGQGLAHPRRLGIACHLGLIASLPAVGCAKSRLVGAYREPWLRRGSRSPLLDKGEVVGIVLRTRDKVKAVFVSVGHKIDLTGAEEVVLACGAGYRLPEPTRLADQLVASIKRRGVYNELRIKD